MPPAVAVINHWLHLAAAVAAVGGTLCLRLAVHPGLKFLPEGEGRAGFERTVRRKFTVLITHSIALLILTGLVNVMRVYRPDLPSLYWPLLLVKLLLVAGLFAIALLLLIPSEALEGFQARRPFWMTVNIVLGLAVLLVSAWLRMLSGPEGPAVG